MVELRIGKFGYLNNFLPYYHLNGMEIVEASPRKMAEMLLKGEIAYAPVPSFFYIKNRSLLRRYRFCVASDGRVMSVAVVSKERRLDESPIAASCDSMTSVNMLRIILAENGRSNEVVEVDENRADAMLSRFKHALVIGDEALRAVTRFNVLLDLGEAWKDLTGLPAVFGIAASRSDVDASGIDAMVLSSLRKAYKDFDEIVRIASEEANFPTNVLAEYFRLLRFEMGSKEERGLIEFERRLREHGII